MLRPQYYALVAGRGEGSTRLNAFDAALLEAGAGNLNLVKVTSILPPGAALQDRHRLPPGTLAPAAYAALTSDVAGERIAAAVAVGVPADPDEFGVIMECSLVGTRADAERLIRSMVEEAFRMRAKPLQSIQVASVDHRVERVGAVFAAVLLW